jgi:RNA polymerase sigma factor (sigma-70 family)
MRVGTVKRVDHFETGESALAADGRLRDLLDRYGALLSRAVARVCPKWLSCDDIEQEARISLWRVLKNEREIAAPASYIHKVALSASLRAIRQARARREESIGDPDGSTKGHAGPLALQTSTAESPHALAERRELRRQIELGLVQLTENRGLAVRLHLQGLPTAEIGELLGWTEPKARNLVYRGLEDLRHALRASGVDVSHGGERRGSARRLTAVLDGGIR